MPRDGSLTFTKVSTGGATKTDVLISNDSNATMNKTTLSVGTFPAPALPAGVTIKAIFGADATATNCPIAADAKSATCSFNNLASGKQKNVSILFGIATAGDKAIELAVKVKETVNDNGANKDTFPAIGDRRGRWGVVRQRRDLHRPEHRRQRLDRGRGLRPAVDQARHPGSGQRGRGPGRRGG